MNRINRKGRKKAMETVSPDGRFSSLTNLGLAYDDFAAIRRRGRATTRPGMIAGRKIRPQDPRA